MNKSTKKSIQQLLLYKHHLKTDSIRSQILELLYPDQSLTLQEISDMINPNYYSYIKKTVFDCKSNNYLCHDEKSYKRKYFLTQMGRWFIMCTKLNIPFLSLCMLASVYNTIKHDGINGIYLISSFRRLFDSSVNEENSSAIYSRQYIFRIVQFLIDRNLVYRNKHRDILQVNSTRFNDLRNNYEQDLIQLHIWINDISIKCDKLLLENYHLAPNMKKLLSLTKSTH